MVLRANGAKPWLAPLALCLPALVSYLPAILWRDFIWDDLMMVRTPAVREPNGLWQICLVAALWLLRHRIGRGPLAGVLFFGVTLSPTVGFVDFNYMQFSFVADRFQYLAGIGVLAVVIGAAARGIAASRGAGGQRAEALNAVLVAALLAVLGTLTWQQAAWTARWPSTRTWRWPAPASRKCARCCAGARSTPARRVVLAHHSAPRGDPAWAGPSHPAAVTARQSGFPRAPGEWARSRPPCP